MVQRRSLLGLHFANRRLSGALRMCALAGAGKGFES
jgi:hypothetical protein